MVNRIADTQQLIELLNETISGVEEFQDSKEPSDLTSETLENLLDQCESLLAKSRHNSEEPIRAIHHLACTGGTLISKCLAASPNVMFLSEIDPLSHFFTTGQYSAHSQKSVLGGKRFAPTDIIADMFFGTRPATHEEVIKVFNASLIKLRDVMEEKGQRIVLRDHSHSHYCSFGDYNNRPSVRAIISEALPVLSVLTVRHPLDSFLSLEANKWFHFSPFTLDEYCKRYKAFLEDHKDVRIFLYEELVATPDATLREILSTLDLPFDPAVFDILPIISISGDSGRSSGLIAHRPRREIPSHIAEQAKTSFLYGKLCARLGYDSQGLLL